MPSERARYRIVFSKQARPLPCRADVYPIGPPSRPAFVCYGATWNDVQTTAVAWVKTRLAVGPPANDTPLSIYL